MKHHVKGRSGHILMATGIFVLLTIVSLWSWNTLAGLFDWPTAQYKHVLAALGLLLVMRFGLFHSHKRVHTLE